MVLQSSQDGGAAVSVSKRKNKPGKQTKGHKATNSTSSPEVRVDVDGRAEIVDPDEERYCVCGDVSYGEMICCELEEKVWCTFSLYVLGLLTFTVRVRNVVSHGLCWNP